MNKSKIRKKILTIRKKKHTNKIQVNSKSIIKILRKKIPKYFVLDVDGVITNGQMIYDKAGKKFKTFGPDDTDALKVLQQFIKNIMIH